MVKMQRSRSSMKDPLDYLLKPIGRNSSGRIDSKSELFDFSFGRKSKPRTKSNVKREELVELDGAQRKRQKISSNQNDESNDPVSSTSSSRILHAKKNAQTSVTLKRKLSTEKLNHSPKSNGSVSSAPVEDPSSSPLRTSPRRTDIKVQKSRKKVKRNEKTVSLERKAASPNKRSESPQRDLSVVTVPVPSTSSSPLRSSPPRAASKGKSGKNANKKVTAPEIITVPTEQFKQSARNYRGTSTASFEDTTSSPLMSSPVKHVNILPPIIQTVPVQAPPSSPFLASPSRAAFKVRKYRKKAKKKNKTVSLDGKSKSPDKHTDSPKPVPTIPVPSTSSSPLRTSPRRSALKANESVKADNKKTVSPEKSNSPPKYHEHVPTVPVPGPSAGTSRTLSNCYVLQDSRKKAIQKTEPPKINITPGVKPPESPVIFEDATPISESSTSSINAVSCPLTSKSLQKAPTLRNCFVVLQKLVSPPAPSNEPESDTDTDCVSSDSESESDTTFVVQERLSEVAPPSPPSSSNPSVPSQGNNSEISNANEDSEIIRVAEFIIEENAIAYPTLRNAYPTNKLVVPANYTENVALSVNQYLLIHGEEEAPGVQKYASSFSDNKYSVGYVKIEPMTLLPMEMWPDRNLVYVVISGTVQLKTPSSWYHRNGSPNKTNYLYGQKFYPGTNIVLPKNTVYSLENWESHPAVLVCTTIMDELDT